MIEVEIKIKLRNPDAIRNIIHDMGAKKKYRMKNVDRYYNAPDTLRDFARTDEALRLRSTYINPDETGKSDHELNSHDLTYKGPKLDKEIKSRVEMVCRILNPKEMDKIIVALGFIPVLTLNKIRESYHLDYNNHAIEILIDEMEGLSGTYLEAELMVDSDCEADRENINNV